MASKGRKLGNGLLPALQKKPTNNQVEAARTRIEANANNYIQVLEDLAAGAWVAAKIGPDGKFQRRDVIWAIVDGGDHDGERIGVYREKPDTRAAIDLADRALGKAKSHNEIDIRKTEFKGVFISPNADEDQLEKGWQESRAN